MIYHYLFQILCFQYKVVSVPYFYDEMQTYEVNDIIEGLQYTDRNLWETSRMNSYILAQVNSKKKLSPTDIIKFNWENNEEAKEIEISNEDIKRLKEKSKKIKINSNGI